MQSFKIDNFLRENPGSCPPKFVSLTESEVNELVERLLASAGRPKGAPEEVIQWFAERSTPLVDLNLDQDEVAMRDLFRRSGIQPGLVLYVQWGPLRDIDRFETDELCKYFYDVWYPSADDIEIFDDTMAWLMFVRHYGGVEVWHQR